MGGSLLVTLGMKMPNREMIDAFKRELELELGYNHQKLDLVISTNEPLWNPQQKEFMIH